jgi:hypothetical protein
VQLGDFGGGGAVDIFSRLLSLNIPTASSTGVPGEYVVAREAPLKGLLVMIHELEHVVCLSRPLGFLLTALGIRSLDTHNAAAVIENEIAGAKPGACSADRAGELIIQLWESYRIRYDTLVVTNLVVPLLEGLALYAEGSLPIETIVDGSASCDLAVALAFQHLRAFGRDRTPPLEVDDDADSYLAIRTRLLDRLQRARSERAGYESTMQLFGPAETFSAASTARYFLGYLFVVRLIDRWKAVTEGALSEFELFSAVARFVCDLFPSGAASVILHTTSWDTAGSVVKPLSAMVHVALGFGPDDVNLLVHGNGVLTWDRNPPRPALVRLEDLSGSPDAAEVAEPAALYSTTTARMIIESVFGPPQHADQDELTLMAELGSGMRLYRLSVEPALVLGVDRERAALEILLRRTGGVTIFKARPEALARFLSHLGKGGHAVSPVDLSAGHQRPTGPEPNNPLPAQVHTWVELYPDGTAQAASDPTDLLGLTAIRRLLVTADTGLLDRDTPEDRAMWMKVRGLVDSEFTASIEKSLVTSWERFPDSLLRGLVAFPANEPRLEKIWRFVDTFSDPSREAERLCLEWYAGLLFPRWRGAPFALVEQKLGPLFALLESATPDGRLIVRRLWSFLKSSVWRLPAADSGAPHGGDDALDVIRAASIDLLGVPLVRQGDRGWEFDLEPPSDRAEQ